MVIARDPRATWKYVLAREQRMLEDGRITRDQVTVFKLKHLTLSEEHRSFDSMDRDSFGNGIRRDLGSDQLRRLRTNLVGWENFCREDGTQIEFEANAAGGPKDELLALLSVADRMELAGAIEAAVVFDPDTVGKSAPLST